MKHIIKLALALTLALTQPAFATPGGRTPEQMMNLFEEYLAHVTSQQPGPIYLEYGRQKYLARSVIAQLAAMEPEDFNVFQFYLMDRYVNTPAERPYLYNFLAATTEALEADFEYTRALQNGPQALALEGAYKYGAWILIAGSLAWRVILARSGNLSAFMRQVRQNEVALNQVSRVYGLSYKVATSPTTWLTVGSIGAGAGLGLLEHTFNSHRTHRLNPMPNLMVVQAQLACHLSYQALGLQDQFEKIKNDPDQLGKSRKQLLDGIKDIRGQAEVLTKQWSRLENLDVRDRLFAKILQQYPKAESWEKFRKDLTDAETSHDGKCRQMSMIHLNRELESTATLIELLAPATEPDHTMPISPEIP